MARDPDLGEGPGLRLRLMRGFELTCDGTPVPLPLGAQRLVAFLALNDRPLPRRYVASTLWMDTSEQRSCATLRTALWRLRRPDHHLVDQVGECLELSEGLSVDVRRLAATFRHLVCRGSVIDHRELPELRECGELLPGWCDEWVVSERERIRQMHLQALEVAMELVLQRGAPGHPEAVALGLAGVAAAPLRESVHRMLIRLHLAQGNQTEAFRQYDRYAGLLRRELQLDPPPDLRELVQAASGDLRRAHNIGCAAT